MPNDLCLFQVVLLIEQLKVFVQRDLAVDSVEGRVRQNRIAVQIESAQESVQVVCCQLAAATEELRADRLV